jgi:hypothetical protein
MRNRKRILAAGAIIAGSAFATVPVAAALGTDQVRVAPQRAAGLLITPHDPTFAEAAYWTRVRKLADAYQLNVFYETLAAQQAAKAAAHRSRGGGGCSEGEIIGRESGGNPQAVNSSSGAGGLYQILPTTWAGRGGYANAADAPVELQQQAYHEVRASNPNAWAASGC